MAFVLDQAGEREPSHGPPADPFAQSRELERDVCELAERHGLEGSDAVRALLALMTRLVTTPNTTFTEPPEYRRSLDGEARGASAPARSSHGFFDVLTARASRRDFGPQALELSRLIAVLQWTFGARGETIAYDFRAAPLRYAPSAGGLASNDAYVIVNRVEGLAPGSYYFDYERGLVAISAGLMGQRVADMNPEQEWVADAAAIIVVVGNAERVARKYGAMGFKLLLLDAGVAIGHAELVATALELRGAILGGLPASQLARLLRIDERERVPLASLAIGTRPGHG